GPPLQRQEEDAHRQERRHRDLATRAGWLLEPDLRWQDPRQEDRRYGGDCLSAGGHLVQGYGIPRVSAGGPGDSPAEKKSRPEESSLRLRSERTGSWHASESEWSMHSRG